MPRIADEVIEQIRAKVDIVEIIKEYIPLSQRGKNFFGVCPFHQDHSPSMSVSRSRQIYKCFSCGAAGNVFKFVSDFENISYIEAVAKIGNKVGINLEVNSKYEAHSKYEKEYEIMNIACLYYQNQLSSEQGIKAKKYLKERGLNEEMIKTFNLGLATSNNTLLSFFKEKRIEENKLAELGLINESNNKYHDIFVNRIIFPIHNFDGRVVGFTARGYEGKIEPKYLNSKETPIFKKGNILFNYHRAKEAVRINKELIIVEGNMDAIRMYSTDFKNTIALMGTTMTTEQIQAIKKLRVPVILMLDNDDAGLIATKNNGKLLSEAEIEVKVVRLQGAKDPDEYILAHGVDAMKENIKHAMSFNEFEYMALRQNKNLGDSRELASYVKEVLNSIKDQDEITKDVTLSKLVEEFHLSYDVLKKELELKEDKSKIELPNNMVKKNNNKESKYDISARHILYAMMNEKKYIDKYQNELGFFKEQKYRDIASEIIDYYKKKKEIDIASFLNYAEISQVKDEIYEVIKSIKDFDLEDNNIDEYIYIIKSDLFESEIKRLKQEQKESLEENAKNEIGLKIVEIKKKIEELKKERSVLK